MEPIYAVLSRSLAISGAATLLASAWSIPLAYYLSRTPRVNPLVYAMEALIGVPTVLVGLLLYLLLSREGPLGFLNLLYTPQAIMVGEALLITPLVTALTYRSLRQDGAPLRELALTLGASEARATLLVLRESAPSIVSSVVMGFSRAIGELGVALVVGGNIMGYTRTLTTSIALATSMGEYELALELGAILTLLTIGVSLVLRLVNRGWRLE